MTLIEQSSKGAASWQVDDTASLVSGSVPVARLAGRIDPSNLPVNAVYSDVQGNILGTALLVTERVEGGFFSSLFTQSGTAYSAAVLADTPAMYWRLGDAAGPVADSSGNGKTGTVAGTVTLGTNGLTLDQDTAATFPGQTSPASVITGPATGIANNATFSVECLVNLTDYFFDSTGTGGGKNGQYLWDSCNGSSEKTALKWNALTVSASPQKFGANSLGAADSNTLYTNGTYPAGAIYHVVYVWDASVSTEYIYVNGVLDISRVSPTNTPSLSFPLVLGARPNAFSANFPSPAKGIIDEVAVYSTALSSARVLAHYNAVSTVLPLALVYAKGVSYTGDLENLVSGANQWRVDNSGTLQAGTVPSARISGGVAPGGTAGGDLGGTYPNPTVLNLSHATGANTLPDAVLSANVPLLNAAVNAYTGRTTLTPASGTVLTLTPSTNAAGLSIGTSGTATAITASATTGTVAALTADGGRPLDARQSGNLAGNSTTDLALFQRSFGTPGGFAYSGSIITANDVAGAPSGATPAYSTGNLLNLQTGTISRLSVANTGIQTFSNWSAPGAPSAFVDNGAGNVDAGSHTWCVVFSDGTMTTLTGTGAAYDTTGGGAGARSVSFTIPLGPNGTTARQIGRSKVGTASPLFRVDGVGGNSLVSDNTTTSFTDNVADASLVTPFYAAQPLKGRINAMGPLSLGSQGTTALTPTSVSGQVGNFTQGGQIVANTANQVLVLTRNAPTGGFGFTHSGDVLQLNDIAAGSAVSSGNLIRAQVNNANRFLLDMTGNVTLSAWAVPSAPTLALAGAGAGNVTNGTHVVCITFVNANGETTAGTSSAPVNVVDNTTNGQISVTAIPTGPQNTTQRKVYMSKAGTASPLFLQSTIADNTTTTATINTDDLSLPATQPPTINTTFGKLSLGAALIQSNTVAGGGMQINVSSASAMTTAGTALAVNAISGLTGTILDLQVAGSSKASVSATGLLTVQGGISSVNAANTIDNLLTQSTSAGVVPLVVRGSTGQTSDLLDIQSSGQGAVTLAKFDNVGNFSLNAITVPGAPTLALAGAGAGNVDNGTHVVAITFVTANGETTIGTSSASVNVVDKTVNGQLSVTAIPLGNKEVTQRKVYISKAGTASPLFLAATIADNTTTTATINTADASLGAQSPGTNNAVGKLSIGPVSLSLSSGGNLSLAGGGLSMADAQNINFGTTTGTQLGTSTAQKMAVYGKTPVIQASAVTAPNTQTASYVQADVQSIVTSLNDLIAKVKAFGITA